MRKYFTPLTGLICLFVRKITHGSCSVFFSSFFLERVFNGPVKTQMTQMAGTNLSNTNSSKLSLQELTFRATPALWRMRRCRFNAVFLSHRSQMRLGFFFFFPWIVLESEPWEEIYLTPLRPVRLLVWTRTRWGGSSSFWVFGWVLGGYGDRGADSRTDRWSSFVWPVGCAQANLETFISPFQCRIDASNGHREDKRSSGRYFPGSSWLRTQRATQIDPLAFSH